MWASFSVQALKIHAFFSGQSKRSTLRGHINECWGFKPFAFCTVHLPCKYLFVILLVVRTSFCDFINSNVIVQTEFTDLSKFVDYTKNNSIVIGPGVGVKYNKSKQFLRNRSKKLCRSMKKGLKQAHL